MQAHELEENIGVVAFGATSRIEHHLSNDYASVRDAIGRKIIFPHLPLIIRLKICIRLAVIHVNIFQPSNLDGFTLPEIVGFISLCIKAYNVYFDVNYGFWLTILCETWLE